MYFGTLYASKDINVRYTTCSQCGWTVRSPVDCNPYISSTTNSMRSFSTPRNAPKWHCNVGPGRGWGMGVSVIKTVICYSRSYLHSVTLFVRSPYPNRSVKKNFSFKHFHFRISRVHQNVKNWNFKDYFIASFTQRRKSIKLCFHSYSYNLRFKNLGFGLVSSPLCYFDKLFITGRTTTNSLRCITLNTNLCHGVNYIIYTYKNH